MKTRCWFLTKCAFILYMSCTLSTVIAQPSGYDQKAKQILDAANIKGGLIVHLGCGDGLLSAALIKPAFGGLTAALHVNDRYLVHGLDTDPDVVAKARKHIQKLGLYGRVSVEVLDGTDLPYADNLVNLLVAEDLGKITMEECLRTLAPNGVAYVKSGNKWNKIVKPRPDAIDEWTHHLHDAGGNAVANDLFVGPPQHLQWTAGPLWARSHGWTPSVSAMVSAAGRLFYISDETLTCADGTVPSKWFVVARDAFSGVLLWKRPIPQWGSEEFSGTPDSGEGVASVGRFTMPSNIGKRLVAVDDTVYVTLGATAPVTALDAATGDEKRVYAETANADEILCDDGRLIVSINPSEKPANAAMSVARDSSPVTRDPSDERRVSPPGAPGKYVCAVNAKTGRVLWKKGPFSGIRAGQTQDPFGRLELAAGDGKVFILTTEAIECLNANSGKTVWRTNRPALPAGSVRRMGFSGMFEYLLTVMVYRNGVVLLAQPEPNTHHTYHTMPGTLYAFDASNGLQMWKHAYGGWGHCTPPDVFVVGEVVWTHVNAETEFGSVWGKGFKAKDSSIVDYRIQALDLRTGEVRRELPTKEIFNVGHHHRCHRNKITERFLMSSRRGVEFVDLSTGQNYQNHWVRSGCLLGYLPCNGLLYVTPHPCSCYISAKLTGFNALAPKRKSRIREIEAAKNDVEPGFEKGPAFGQIGHYQTAIGNPDEWPTYRHDAQRSGASESPVSTDLKVAWRANIGTKPSGLVVASGKVFVAGSDTHTVYALNADNGKNIWRYTAGSRVDSPPTFHNGLAIFGSADGRVYCLGAADGALVWRFDAAPRQRLVTAFGQLESSWPVPGRMSPETSGNLMSGLLNDIPATDGANVFIRQMKVWSRLSGTGRGSSSGGRDGQHLYTTGGYLDPSWFNRTFWQVRQARTSGLMVLGKDVAYGVEVYDSRSRETGFSPGAMAYRLRCIPLKATARGTRNKQAVGRRRQQGPKPLWEQRVRIRITAMVRTGETIFVAGSPDVIDPKDPHGAWEGRKGGILAAFAAGDGRKLAEYKMPAPPVWDGMAAAGGRLFISTSDGYVVCMGKRQENEKR